MPAVIALAAGDVGTNDNAVANLEGYAFKVVAFAVASDQSDRANVFVPLNKRKWNLPVAILRGESLERVLVRAANTGEFHLHENPAGRWVGQGKLPKFVPVGFHERRG